MTNPTAYRIRNWDKHYETNTTRKIKYLEWFKASNDHGNDGYIELMLAENGNFAVYGAWIAIVGVASKCSPRGTLIKKDGTPHTANTLALITRGSRKQIQQALDLLSLPMIGWLEQVPISATTVAESPTCPAEISHSSATNLPPIRHQSATTVEISRGTERNGTERNGITTAQTAAPVLVSEIPKAKKAPEDRTLTIPPNLNTPAFKDAWLMWLEYRKQSKRKAYTPIGAQQQVNKLAEYGEQRAIAAIMYSIRQGYQGIIEETGKQGGYTQATQAKPKMPLYVPQTPKNPVDRAELARNRLVGRARDKLSPMMFRSCMNQQEVCGRMAEAFADMGEVIEWIAAEKELANLKTAEVEA